MIGCSGIIEILSINNGSTGEVCLLLYKFRIVVILAILHSCGTLPVESERLMSLRVGARSPASCLLN